MQLITGGMGFIGLHTAKAFIDAGEPIVVTRYRTTRMPSFLKDELDKRLFVETVDISNPFDILEVARKHGVTGIVHLAAPPWGKLAEEYRVHMAGLINVLETARILGMQRVSFGSSATVYLGAPAGAAYQEDVNLSAGSIAPIEAYKKAEEILSLAYAQRCGLDLVCLRLAGIFGPCYHNMNNLPSRLVHAAVQGRPGPLPHADAQRNEVFAEEKMDQFYVKDAGRAIESVHMAPKLHHRVYNIGSGRATSNAELAEAVRKVIPEAKITLQPGQPPRSMLDQGLDTSRLNEMGFQPRFTIESAIADYIAWLRAGNPE